MERKESPWNVYCHNLWFVHISKFKHFIQLYIDVTGNSFYVRTVNFALDKRLDYSYRNGSESTSHYIASSSVSVHNQSFACEGDEKSLSDCRTSTLDNCSDSSVVSVRCQGEVFSNDTCKSAFSHHPYHDNDHNHHQDVFSSLPPPAHSPPFLPSLILVSPLIPFFLPRCYCRCRNKSYLCWESTAAGQNKL